MNLVSNMVVPEMAKEDILHRDTEGTKRFEEFVSERVVGTTASKSVWEPIKKRRHSAYMQTED